jgi:FkbM family methyltransferase
MDSSNAQRNEITGTHETASLRLRIRDGLTIVVPPTLSAITTYVLLEQEDWFEKEICFLRCFLNPGMNAIDIGANLGVYSLSLARLVGPNGRVFSYEPGREARALLEHSRALNNLENLEVIAAALSDSERKGHLAFAVSSELRALGPAGSGEAVDITSLDVEDAARRWPSPDFVKIDAEGEEERIIAGGRVFFSTHSPLVMFEIKAGDKVNDRLLTIISTIGYRVYRQLTGAPILVPHDIKRPLDGFELNLFAAKPDRASALSQRGLLVDTIPPWVPGDDDKKNAISFWRSQKFASSTSMFGANGVSADFAYQNCLVAYATWRAVDLPASARCAALASAFHGLLAVCANSYTAERGSTLARVAWEWGAREECVKASHHVVQILQSTGIQFGEPFWPASPRFDDISPGARLVEWFADATVEQYERSRGYSSCFSGASSVLDWLCSQPFASAEMERRRTLVAAGSGRQPKVPERLCTAAPDHLNAEIWRRGMVPGTVVGA